MCLRHAWDMSQTVLAPFNSIVSGTCLVFILPECIHLYSFVLFIYVGGCSTWLCRVNRANSDCKVIRTMAIPMQNKNPVQIASFSNSLTTITISYSFIIWLSDCDQATPHNLVITTTHSIGPGVVYNPEAIDLKFRQGKPFLQLTLPY